MQTIFNYRNHTSSILIIEHKVKNNSQINLLIVIIRYCIPTKESTKRTCNKYMIKNF